MRAVVRRPGRVMVLASKGVFDFLNEVAHVDDRFDLRLMKQAKLMVVLRSKLRNMGEALYPMGSSKRMQISISKPNDVASVAHDV